MSIHNKMALRMGIYLIFLSYLVGDLFVFKGPVFVSLNEPAKDEKSELAEAKADGIAARVYQRPIFKKQLEEALKEYLWRRGRSLDETSVSERRMLRMLILDQLIDDELIKLQITVTESEVYAIGEEILSDELEIENRRYLDPSAFKELAIQSGWQGFKEQKLRVMARLQRELYLESATHTQVSDEEVHNWIENHREDLGDFQFDELKPSIVELLTLEKKDAQWRWFRLNRLRHRAEGKIQVFDQVVFEEES